VKTTYEQMSRLSGTGLTTLPADLVSKESKALAIRETKYPESIVRFGTFEVDLESRELRKHGMRVRLEEKPFRILQLLLEQAGRVVTRRALREKLWPDTHVGYDQNLNTAVNKLRELLGDSAQNSCFIETLPRLGYRFIAPIMVPGRPSLLAPKKMLAVLPFENLGGDPGKEYFAEGLTEEMISHLGQLDPRRLGVIARTSAIQYKNTRKSIMEISSELKVSYVLEGSVRCEGSGARITAQLIESLDQTHVWSASYNRDLRDILSVQADVARQVGRALSLELLPEAAAKSLAFDPTAHESYLRGRFYFGQRTEEGLRKAISSFETALSIEPNCARSYSGIADCCGLLSWFGALAPKVAGQKAAAAAKRAVEIDMSLSECHASLALVRFWYDWNWEKAEQEFLRAIELNPSYTSAYQWYAAFLNTQGRFEEAQAAQKSARELDPFSLISNMNVADSFFFSRQYDRAVKHLVAVLEQEPRFFAALLQLGRVYVQMELYAEAIAVFEQALQLSRQQEVLPALAHAYALAGRSEDARIILNAMTVDKVRRYVASPMIARIYLGLGEFETALDWLQEGLEERSYWMVFLKEDPVYDPIRTHPRFSELLKLMGLAS
jgi:TolB-like protein/DNA-binding winged helix-turn-helix (wHTH) protein/Flp pilus assembly protein TadD